MSLLWLLDEGTYSVKKFILLKRHLSLLLYKLQCTCDYDALLHERDSIASEEIYLKVAELGASQQNLQSYNPGNTS